jgi:hypothetical protein
MWFFVTFVVFETFVMGRDAGGWADSALDRITRKDV